MKHRVAITGIGCITPLGNSYQEVKESVLSGKSGIKYSEELDWTVASVDYNIDEQFDRYDLQVTDRFSRGGYLAYKQARADSGIDPQGIYLGVSGGGSHELTKAYEDLFDKGRVRPNALVSCMMNSAVNFIARKEQIKGPAFTYTAACASSLLAMGEAYKAIAYGDYDSIATGGTDFSLTDMNIAMWKAMTALSEESKPFSASRKGIVLSEGSAIFFFERLDKALERGAKIYGEVIGYGTSCGSETITKPDEEGQIRAIQNCLRDIYLKRITYINAHGTGTPVGDLVELGSIQKVFGDLTKQIPISSTKSLHGHLLGGSGAMETLSCLAVLETEKIIPNWGLVDPDPEISKDILLTTELVDKSQDVCLNNSFAFGGTNVVLALGKYHEH